MRIFSLFILIFVLASCSELDKEQVKPRNEVESELQAFVLNQVDLMQHEKVPPVIESRGNDPECFDPTNPGLDLWCDPLPYSETYTVVYDGCPIQVTMSFFYCFDFTANHWFVSTGEITNINAGWFSLDCAPHVGEILNLFYSGQTEELADLLDDRNYQLELGWEQQFVQEYIASNANQTFFCDTGTPHIVIENFKGSCYQYCLETINGQFTWTKIRCGFGCCKRTSSYCVDRNTMEIVSDVVVESTEPCTWDPEPYKGCSGVLTECRETCSKIK